MDIIEQLFRRRTMQESLKVAAAGTLCVLLGMWAHLDALFFSALMCISVRLFYRHYTWQRCLSGLGAATLHMLAVLAVVYFAHDQFSLMVLGISVYMFGCGFLSGMGKPDLETVFLAMFTPYIYVTVMTTTGEAASTTAYWYAQMALGFLMMLVVGSLSKRYPYRHALEQRCQELLVTVQQSLLGCRVEMAIDKATFDTLSKQVHEIYSSNSDREHYWMNALLWIRNIATIVVKFNRCFRLISDSRELRFLLPDMKMMQHGTSELLEKMQAILTGRANRLGYCVTDFKARIIDFAKIIDRFMQTPEWKKIPAKSQLAIGEMLSGCQLLVRFIDEWAAFYQDNKRKIVGFTYRTDFLNVGLIEPAVIYASKIVVAYCLAMLVYRYFAPIIPSQFIATVLIISIEINLVSTLRKVAMRIVGSLVGLGLAIIGLALYAHLSSTFWLLIYVFFVLFLSAYCCRPDAKYPYGGAMIAVMCLVGMLNAPGLSTEVNFIINRCEGILGGIVIAVFVTLIFWSYHPERAVVKRLALAIKQINDLSDLMLNPEFCVQVEDRFRGRRLAIETLLTKLRVMYLDYKAILSPKKFGLLASMMDDVERYYLVVNATLQAMQYISYDDRRTILSVLRPVGVPLHQIYHQLVPCLKSQKGLEPCIARSRQLLTVVEDKIDQGGYRRDIPVTSALQRSDYALFIGHQLIMAELLTKLGIRALQLMRKEVVHEQNLKAVS